MSRESRFLAVIAVWLATSSAIASASDAGHDAAGIETQIQMAQLSGDWYVIGSSDRGAACHRVRVVLRENDEGTLVFADRHADFRYAAGVLVMKSLFAERASGTLIQQCRASGTVVAAGDGLIVGVSPWFRTANLCENARLNGAPPMRHAPNPAPGFREPDDCWGIVFRPLPSQLPRVMSPIERQVVRFLRSGGTFYWEGPHSFAPSCAAWTVKFRRANHDGLSGELINVTRDGDVVVRRKMVYGVSTRFRFELEAGGSTEDRLLHGRSLGRSAIDDWWTPPLAEHDPRTVGVSGWFKTEALCRAAKSP